MRFASKRKKELDLKTRPVRFNTTPSGPDREQFQWKSVAVLTSAHMITDIYNNFLPPLMPLLIQKMNLTLTLAGSLVTMRSIASFFIQPAVGYISDRTGLRIFVLFGPLVTGIFIGLLGIAPSYWFLALCLIMGGIGHSSLHPQGAAMIGDIGRRRAAFFMSVWMIAGQLGMALGPVLVILTVSMFGLNGTVYTIVFAVIITVFLIRFAPTSPSKKDRTDAYSLRTHLFPRIGALAVLWLLAVIRTAIGMSFLSFLSVLLVQKGFPLFISGLAVSLFSGGGAAGSFIGGILSDRVGRKRSCWYLSAYSPWPFSCFSKPMESLHWGS
jgi:FSR family fosmidomycin resistance protein-like MFS transporter